jgi:hypothetical protein
MPDRLRMTSQMAGKMKPSNPASRPESASSMRPRGSWQMYDWK